MKMVGSALKQVYEPGEPIIFFFLALYLREVVFKEPGLYIDSESLLSPQSIEPGMP